MATGSSIQEGAYGFRGAVIPGRNLDPASAACRMDNLSVTDIHGYVIDGAFAVGVKDQVARAHLTGFDAPSGLCLLPGSSGKTDTCNMA